MMKKFIEAGRQFLTSYSLSNNDDGPIMLPPAPDQKFVDLFSSEDFQDESKRDYNEKRIDYDAECVVYKALEKVDQRIIVLHNFKYFSRQKNAVCKKTNCQPRINISKGEHDFVVIVPNSAVICIEVKRPHTKEVKFYEKLYDTGSIQANSCMEVLHLLYSHCSTRTQYKQLKFCAFPLAKKIDGMICDPGVAILWEDDVKQTLFSTIRKKLIESKLTLSSKCDSNIDGSEFELDLGPSHFECSMIGLWLLNYEDLPKLGRNLWGVNGHTMKKVDDKLRSQKISLKPKKQLSENLVPVPKEYREIFENYLCGIKYITKEQLKLLELSQGVDGFGFKLPNVFVNGPAGSGKTLIMYARILKLLQCMGVDEQIFLLLPWRDAAEKFGKKIREFDNDITMKIIDIVFDIRQLRNNGSISEEEVFTLFKKKMEECKETVIIFVRPNFSAYSKLWSPSFEQLGPHSCILDTLKRGKLHIFCDDFHSSFAHSMLQNIKGIHGVTKPVLGIDRLAEFLLQNPLRKCRDIQTSSDVDDADDMKVWISCDLMQVVQFHFWENYELQPDWSDRLTKIFDNQIKISLSGNLRNCHGIALLLIDLVKKFLELTKGNCQNLRKILPGQDSLHFIEGFSTKLYCVNEQDSEESLKNIIKTELQIIIRSYQAAEFKDEMLAIIPVYNLGSVLNRDAAKEWPKKIRSLVRDITKHDNHGLREFSSEAYFTDFVMYANSMEFPCVVLVVDLSPSGDYFPQEKRSTLMHILAHLYSGISRARVYCSIILIGSENTPLGLFKEIRNILLPHVNEIMTFRK